MPLKSDYTASNDWMRVNNELGTMWKEVVKAQFKSLILAFAWRD
jgi:hypothetical protein